MKVARERLSQLFLEVGGKYVADEDVADATLVDLASASTPAGKAAYLDFAWWLWKEDAAAKKRSSPYFQDGGKLSAFSNQTDRERCIAVCMSSWDSVPAHHTVKRALGGEGISRPFVLTLVRYFKARLGHPVSFDSLLQMEPILDSVQAHPISNKSMSSIPVKEIDVENGNGHPDGSDVRTEQAAESARSDHVSNAARKRPTPRIFPKEMARFLSDLQLDAGLSDEGRALLLNLGSKFEPFAIPLYAGSDFNVVKGFELLALGGDGENYPVLLKKAQREGVEKLLGVALFKVALLSADALYNEIKSRIIDLDWSQFRFSINVDGEMLRNTAFVRLIEREGRRPYQVLFEASEDLRSKKEVDALFVILDEAESWTELAVDDSDMASTNVREMLLARTKFIKVDRELAKSLYVREQEHKGRLMMRLQSLRMDKEAVIVEGVSSRDMKRYLHKKWNVSSHGEFWMQGYHIQVPEPWTGVLRPLNSSDPETPEAYVLSSDQVLTPAVESLNDGRCEQGISPISMGADEQTRFEARIQEAIVKVLIDERQEKMVARLFGEHVSFKMDQVANALSAWWASRDALARIELFRERVELIAKGLKEPRSGQERSVFAGEATRILALLALACVDRKMAMLNRDVAGSVEQLNLQFGVSIEVYRFGRDDIEDLKPVIRRVDDNNDWVGKGEPEWTGGGGVNKTLLPELGPLEASEYVIKLQKNLFLDLHPNQRTFEDFNLTAVQLDYLNDRLSKEGRYVALHDLQMQKEGSPLLDEGVWARFKEDLPDVPVFRFGVVKVGERSVFLVKEGRLLGAIARFMEMIERYE